MEEEDVCNTNSLPSGKKEKELSLVSTRGGERAGSYRRVIAVISPTILILIFKDTRGEGGVVGDFASEITAGIVLGKRSETRHARLGGRPQPYLEVIRNDRSGRVHVLHIVEWDVRRRVRPRHFVTAFRTHVAAARRDRGSQGERKRFATAEGGGPGGLETDRD